MKTIIIALAIFALMSTTYAGSLYFPVQPQNYDKDPLISSMQKYGLDTILADAVKQGKISSADFKVSAINSIFKKTETNALYYKYDLSLKNMEGDTLNTVFTVQNSKQTKINMLMQYTLNVVYAKSMTPGADMNMGADSDMGKDANSDMDMGKNSNMDKNANSKKNMDANTDMDKSQNSDMDMNMDMDKGANSGMDMGKNSPMDKGTNPNMNKNSNSDMNMDKNSDMDMDMDKNSDMDKSANSGMDMGTNSGMDMGKNSPMDKGTNPNMNQNSNSDMDMGKNSNMDAMSNADDDEDDDSMIPLDESEYTSAIIQQLAAYGKNSIVRGAIAKKNIPAGKYSISQIISVEKEVFLASTNYMFEVEIVKSDESTILEASFMINYRKRTQRKMITQSSYEVLPGQSL